MSASDMPALPGAIERPVRTRQAVLCGLIVTLGAGFGLQYASARMMGLEGVAPMGALWLIHLGLSAVFTAVLMAAGKLFRPSFLHVCFFVVITVFTNIGQLGVELIAAHHVPAGELTLIVSLLPVFVLILSSAFRIEPVTPRRAGGMLLGVAASSAILLPSAMDNRVDLFWLAVAFIAPVSQSIGMILMARLWPKDLDPLQVATGNLVMGTVLLGPIASLSGGSVLPAASAAGWVATLLFALTMAAEFYVFALLLRKGGATLASCADFIAVCAGLLFGFLLFGEIPTMWMIAAALLCGPALKLATDRPA
jgi:drug/metabolite transporter (DMT)-like permease